MGEELNESNIENYPLLDIKKCFFELLDHLNLKLMVSTKYGYSTDSIWFEDKAEHGK